MKIKWQLSSTAAGLTVITLMRALLAASSNDGEQSSEEQRSRPAVRLPLAARLSTTVVDQRNNASAHSLPVDRQSKTLEQLIGVHEQSNAARDVDTGAIRYICITKERLCDDVPDCPNSEDEDRTLCMFYHTLHYELHQIRRMIANNFERVAAQMLNQLSADDLT